MSGQATLAAKTAANAVTAGGPNLLREIIYGTSLGIFVGAFWKMHHINYRRRIEDFYAALEQGEITVEASS